MIRSIITALAAASIALLGAGVASADTPDEIAAQCARATIPTALCSGGVPVGGSEGDGIGRVKFVDKGKYFSGTGPSSTIGLWEKPILDEDGNPVLDGEGNETFEQIPITAPGSPIFTPYSQAQPGQYDSDGNLVMAAS